MHVLTAVDCLVDSPTDVFHAFPLTSDLCVTLPPPGSDALREVKKYSASEPMQDAKLNPNLFDHMHMKLFRAQRNLYISGFSLFLWL